MNQSEMIQMDMKQLFIDCMTAEQYKVLDQNRTINVILHLLAVVPDSVTWTKDSSHKNDKAFTGEVTFVNHKDGALAQVTVPEWEKFYRTTLNKGIIKELPVAGRTITIQQAGDDELKQEFGDYVEIDVCQDRLEKKLSETQDPVSKINEYNLTNGMTTALISCTKKESEWTFQCQVAMTGLVTGITTAGGVCHGTFGEIITVLKDKPQFKYLKDVTVDGNHIRFTVSGTVDYRWQCHHEVTWKKVSNGGKIHLPGANFFKR